MGLQMVRRFALGIDNVALEVVKQRAFSLMRLIVVGMLISGLCMVL